MGKRQLRDSLGRFISAKLDYPMLPVEPGSVTAIKFHHFVTNRTAVPAPPALPKHISYAPHNPTTWIPGDPVYVQGR